ncbi:Calponin homology domain [Macleaya cordata]|uniref:Calponin homology domain n=1 Tax=Macleaya cordata TaxID=56857 RepID=A0A200RDR4_MACCD|nr:Calponin homology domain [Macleaya cordata]
MEDPSKTVLHDIHLASRKAEEAALRRYQAAGWLESFVGPVVGLSNQQPTELEFVTCLKNGLVLCNLINKIQPGSVPKVIEGNSPSLASEGQPLLAYQYFENVRNFLVAVAELNLPAFEASDLETDTLEGGSSAKIVDCVLALKSYHEWKQWRGDAGGFYNKHARSPMFIPLLAATGKIHSQAKTPLGPRRHLDMSSSVVADQATSMEAQNSKHQDSLIGALAQCLMDTKENIDHSVLDSFRRGNVDSQKFFSKIMSSCLQEQQLNQFPELRLVLIDSSLEGSNSIANTTSTPTEKTNTIGTNKCCKACMKRGSCNHRHLLKVQERDLMDLKTLLSRTKKEVEVLQIQFQSDLKQIGNQVQELASAALGYGRAVKENRDLYNMVQDLKGNIRVYCRIKPTFGNETKNVIDFIGDDGSLVVVDPLNPHKDGQKVFRFNRVFDPAASQEEVFKDTKPVIRSVMDGFNVCIFAYGQTGSGKTHTMCGPTGASAQDMGVNYRALNDLFNISHLRKDIMNYEIRVQMVEIYNEQVRDLLAEDISTKKYPLNFIRNCTSNGRLSLPHATMHLVVSTEDVLNLMKLGEMNRAVSSTAINNRSSRSHSVLTVHVQGKDTSGGILHSCLHLVDLAGSERVDKSEVTGDRLKEAQYINKSLSCLGDVIMALAQKNSHIPYRNSKLTQLLQDSLGGGHAKTLMFAHVSPEADSLGETVTTLKFAQRVSTVELGAALLNKENTEVRELREQVEILKKALASKEEHAIKQNQVKELRSPRETLPKVMTERTPPRPCRLSIENNSVVKFEKVTNPGNRKGSKTPVVKEKPVAEYTPNRSRRSSLEGPKCVKERLQIRVPENEVCASSGCQNGKAINSSSKYRDQSPLTEEYHQIAPRSPTSAILGNESRKRIHPVQLLKTPEPITRGRNEFQIVTPNDFGLSTKYQTPNVVSTTSRKGSQIRKSLQTIGKLINGSERRNQQKQCIKETESSNNGNGNVNDGKSPLTSNGRPLRRQSLTGGQVSGVSRRSSLGGKSTTDSYSNDTRRNARTPPPVHLSDQMTKRWLEDMSVPSSSSSSNLWGDSFAGMCMVRGHVSSQQQQQQQFVGR